MKIKTDFVTNSSSTSFIIDVKTETLTAEEFVSKLIEYGLCEHWIFENVKPPYTDGEISERMVASLKDDYDIFPLNRGCHRVVFGDEHGTFAGDYLDYALRDVNKCGSFSVEVDQYLR